MFEEETQSGTAVQSPLPLEKTWVQLVQEFTHKFGLLNDGLYRFEGYDSLAAFRLSFLQEEICETRDAFHANDPVGALDGLVDIIYVAIGTASLYGWDLETAFRRVHEANMRKVRVKSASESKRNSSYDISKPPGWQPANLDDLV